MSKAGNVQKKKIICTTEENRQFESESENIRFTKEGFNVFIEHQNAAYENRVRELAKLKAKAKLEEEKRKFVEKQFDDVKRSLHVQKKELDAYKGKASKGPTDQKMIEAIEYNR